MWGYPVAAAATVVVTVVVVAVAVAVAVAAAVVVTAVMVAEKRCSLRRSAGSMGAVLYGAGPPR
ncbi:hypothetical protein [Candidatus Thiodictyon syntrophicum]|uniref:hypothetical protein n=1 Tax=Candidatus Thiodictyon syntrophicum TaxID=1166950 RepID=UPI001561BDFA|nr:hypothetical protein [Candidatus Thiodictyon syntrophicum]